LHAGLTLIKSRKSKEVGKNFFELINKNNKIFMKKVVKLACILLLALMIFTDAKAQFSAGGGILYGFDLERVGIRADGLYTINESWRAGADVGYYFP
jgi:hypothetical protein